MIIATVAGSVQNHLSNRLCLLGFSPSVLADRYVVLLVCTQRTQKCSNCSHFVVNKHFQIKVT